MMTAEQLAALLDRAAAAIDAGHRRNQLKILGFELDRDTVATDAHMMLAMHGYRHWPDGITEAELLREIEGK